MIRHGLALHIADKDLIGTKMSFYWGFSYRLFDVRYSIFYPIPLNLVIRYALKFYWIVYSWLHYGGWQNKLDDAYWQGYNDGNTEREHHMDSIFKTLQEANKEYWYRKYATSAGKEEKE